MIDGWVRARVLEAEPDRAVLGVFIKGMWHRIQARTEVTLTKGQWIEGHLIVRPEESLVLFQLDRNLANPPDEIDEERPLSQEGIDVEA